MNEAHLFIDPISSCSDLTLALSVSFCVAALTSLCTPQVRNVSDELRAPQGLATAGGWYRKTESWQQGSGFEAVPSPQSFPELFHHRQRLSSLDPLSCQPSACHRQSRSNVEGGPCLAYLGLAHLGCSAADLTAEG